MPLIGTIASNSATTSVSSVALTTNTTIAAGTTLVGTVVVEAAAGTNPTLTVSDTHSNSYSIDIQSLNGTNASTSIFSCRVATQINSGDTITVSASDGTRSRWAITVQAFNDILNPRLDKTATFAGSGTSLSAGTTATTTSANELVYGAFGLTSGSGQTFTAGSGFTASAQVNASPGTANRSGISEWKYVAATGAQNPTGTLNASATFAAATATYNSASANQAPTANAGPDQNVTVGSTVTLDGSGSSDPDGTIASYAWTQISGTSVTLSSTTVAKLTFTAPSSPASLVFGLTVTDNLGATSTQDTVTITVGSKVGFVAEAAAGTSTTSGTSFTLTFGKTVSAGHTLLIGIAVDCPTGSDVSPTFSATDTKGNTYTVSPSVGYQAATVGTGILSCYVTSSLSTSDTLTISTVNPRGRWAVSVSEFDNIHQSGFDVSASNNSGSTTTLVSGTTATTQNQVEVLFAAFGFGHNNSQTFTAGTNYTQAGSQQSTGNASGHRAVANEYRIFTAAAAQQATGTLSASAGYSAAIATFAADLISNQTPTANAGSPQTVAAFAAVTLDGTGSSDPDGTIASYAWTQTAGPTVTLSSTTVAKPTFTAPGVDGGTTLTFSLVVTDNLGATSTNSATVNITVNSAENFIAHSGSWSAMPEYAAHASVWS